MPMPVGCFARQSSRSAWILRRSPQVSSEAIAKQLAAPGCDGVLGPATDGGWWSLALMHPRWARGLSDVPMSTPHTGNATLTMLRGAGARVMTADRLTDVDTATDAALVAGESPDTRFALTWQRLVSGTHSPAALFDEALAGAPCVLHGMPKGPVELPVETWRGGCDEADHALVGAVLGAYAGRGLWPRPAHSWLGIAGNGGTGDRRCGRGCPVDAGSRRAGDPTGRLRCAAGRRSLGVGAARRWQHRDRRRPGPAAPPGRVADVSRRSRGRGGVPAR